MPRKAAFFLKATRLQLFDEKEKTHCHDEMELLEIPNWKMEILVITAKT